MNARMPHWAFCMAGHDPAPSCKYNVYCPVLWKLVKFPTFFTDRYLASFTILAAFPVAIHVCGALGVHVLHLCSRAQRVACRA